MIWTYKDSCIHPPHEFTDKPFMEFHENYKIIGARSTKFGRNNPLHPCCIYCGSELEKFFPGNVFLQVCQTCGWWVVTRHWNLWYGEEEPVWFANSACGVLANLDLNDLSIPTTELNDYLVAKYKSRIEVHPRKMELIVASIFKSIGYQVRITAYSRDGGIDLYVFDGNNNDIIGVQVKRYRNKIEAEQIRSFAGALLLNGLEHGIYVTTGEFTSGALMLQDGYKSKGFRIELWDAKKLYDALLINKTKPYASASDPSAPFFKYVSNPDVLQTTQ